jgi:phage-related baseplate assembly protein
MASSTDSFTGVDISTLPAPQIISALDFATIRDTVLSDLRRLAPQTEGLGPADPLVKLIDLFAYRELLLRQQLNEAARALLPALATGSDLDHLAVIMGVKRLTAETDNSLRIRLSRAPEAWSVAGPSGAYLALATAAHPDIAFVSVSSPSPANVTIAVQSKSEGGVAPQVVIDAVTAATSAASVRPIADRVTVQAAQMIALDVTATIRTYPDAPAATTVAAAGASLQAWLGDNARLGRDITTDALIAALRVKGVSKVTLVAPTIDLVCTEVQSARAGILTITHGGVGG